MSRLRRGGTQYGPGWADLWHAEWALWQLGIHAEALAPQPLRAALQDRAQTIADRYRDDP